MISNANVSIHLKNCVVKESLANFQKNFSPSVSILLNQVLDKLKTIHLMLWQSTKNLFPLIRIHLFIIKPKPMVKLALTKIESAKSSKETTMTRFERFTNMTYLQGDPNQNLLFQMALPLKQCISDPMFVKSKLVWEAVVFCVKS